MEYDPTVSTHKASSITSTTSTSSNSTWDHPISSYTASDLKVDKQDQISNLEDYRFGDALVSDRIAVPPFEFTTNNTKRNFDSFLDSFIQQETEALSELVPSPNCQKQDNATYIKKKYHEKDSSNSETCLHKGNGPDQLINMTRDNMFSPPSNTISFTPIYLQHGDQITVPSISLANNRHQKTSSRTSRSNNASSVRLIRPLPASTISTTTSTTPSQCRQRSNSISSITSSSKRSRLNKDLLTDDEKRVNHIASEQKRRNTIHLGFKNLTDIIPTLKNINNSKSTILFKAVEYIKHLDKRNRGLRETISSLQVRTNVEGRMIQQQQQRRYHHKAIDKCNNSTTLIDYYNPQQPQQHHRLSLPTIESQQKHEFSHLPANAVSALMAHKNQQRQLEELQEQLRVQQQLLAKHNIFPNSSASPPKLASTAASFTQDLFSTTTTTTITTAATETTSNSSNAPTLLQCPETYQYNSISIPSSRSSNSDENENLHHNHQSLIVPQDLQEHQLTSCSNQLTKRPWQSTDNS